MHALLTPGDALEQRIIREGGIVPPSMDEIIGLRGYGHFVLADEHGDIKQAGFFVNKITDIGDRYYAERASSAGTPPAQITGMQLGTGTTAPSKTGAGAAIVTLVAASLVAITGGFPTTSQPGGATTARRIQWQTLWGAGVATANGIAEWVIANQSTGTQTAVPEANTIARALASPVVNKGASDTLTVTWNHDLLGA